MGLTVLRTWAYSDGDQWNAIQLEMGKLNDTILAQVRSSPCALYPFMSLDLRANAHHTRQAVALSSDHQHCDKALVIAAQGLDRVVAAAQAHGLRLVLTLTNYLPAYGGAPQWVQWGNGTSIADFWTSLPIRFGLWTLGRSLIDVAAL